MNDYVTRQQFMINSGVTPWGVGVGPWNLLKDPSVLTEMVRSGAYGRPADVKPLFVLELLPT